MPLRFAVGQLDEPPGEMLGSGSWWIVSMIFVDPRLLMLVAMESICELMVALSPLAAAQLNETRQL